jgi:alpha-ribazole phosphatase
VGDVTTVDLLRHGVCEGGEIFRGTTDVPLTPQGWRQLREAVAELAGGVTLVVSSDLQRCRAFAEELAGQWAVPLQVEKALQEMHFGEWEGQLINTVRERHGDSLRAFWSDPVVNAPPGGDSMADVHGRVVPCMAELLDMHRGEHLLVLSHGGAIRALICHWLHMPLQAATRLYVPYACLTRFRIHHREGSEPWVQLCSHGGAE